MMKLLKQSVVSLTVVMALASNAFAINLPSFSPLVKEASPAVVNISTERVVRDSFGSLRGLPPDMQHFFEQFGPFFGNNGGGRERSKSALGTGFIISKDGYIVTNNHVVEGASKIFVNFEGSGNKKDSVEAKLIGTDPETDIALLKVEVKQNLPILEFGDSEALEVGDWVLAIGNPFGLSSTVTAGILSAKGRDIHSGPYDNFLQTDASINPGNSGGPLLNMEGEVIGINTAIAASGQGIGFAIPSNLAQSVVDQLKTGKKVSRGWIGVTIQDLDEMTAKALGVKQNQGAMIGSVLPGDPADKAGMRSGDIVIKIGNSPIKNAAELTRVIGSYKPNSSVKIVAIRDGKEKTFTVTLGERNGSQSAAQGENLEQGTSNLGITVRSLTAEDIRNLKIDGYNKGLIIIDIKRNGRAAEAGIQANDVILAANLKPVSNTQQLAKIVEGEGMKRGGVVLQIYRQGNIFLVTVPLGDKK